MYSLIGMVVIIYFDHGGSGALSVFDESGQHQRLRINRSVKLLSIRLRFNSRIKLAELFTFGGLN